MTAAVYMRGLLQHEYGVKPSDVEWVQGRADRLGRKLPPDVRLDAGAARRRARRSARARRDRLHDDGQQSAVVSARRPNVRRLFPELRRAGEGLLPAHQDLSDHAHGGDPRATSTSAIRGWRSVSTRRSAAAKEHCYRMLLETGSPKASFAWLQPMIEEEQRSSGRTGTPTASSRTGRRSRRCCSTRTSTA